MVRYAYKTLYISFGVVKKKKSRKIKSGRFPLNINVSVGRTVFFIFSFVFIVTAYRQSARVVLGRPVNSSERIVAVYRLVGDPAAGAKITIGNSNEFARRFKRQTI